MTENCIRIYKLTLLEKDLGFPRSTLEKCIRDPQEAVDFIMKGGRPLLAEVIIKNWASGYFRRDMELNTLSNQFGFDIKSTDGEIKIEVKTSWSRDLEKYVSFQNIDQKTDKDGNYAFTHIAFYSPHLGPNGVVLFTSKKFAKEVIVPRSGKLNIKINLNEGRVKSNCHRSSEAFYNNIKWM